MKGRKTEAIIIGESALFSGAAEGEVVSSDAKALLSQLKRSHYLIAFVSEMLREEVDAVLKAAGIEGVFHAVVSREDLGGRRFKEVSDFPWKHALDRLNTVKWGRLVRRVKGLVGYRPYADDRALALAGSTDEVNGVAPSNMSVVKVGKTDGKRLGNRPNPDHYVDNVILSLAELVGKKVNMWTPGWKDVSDDVC